MGRRVLPARPIGPSLDEDACPATAGPGRPADNSGVEISYLGIDVGGTKVALRAEGAGRAPYEVAFTWPVPSVVGRDLEALAGWVDAVRAEWPEPLAGVGVAMPATLDGAGRVVTWPSRAAWTGLDLGAELRSLFPDVRVSCADDGDLAAAAEAREAGCRDLLYIGIGTGVGGGLVLDGQIRPGLGRGSCELGHVIVDRFGPRCDCGRRGCLQAVASGPAILRRAAELRHQPVTFAELTEAMGRHRSWALTAVNDACAALSVAIVSLTELVRPTLVLIGGGVAAALPSLVPTVSTLAAGLARPGQPVPPVRPAALGGLSSLHGALLLARGL
ncbi:ROK family protein [Micromonospora sp. NPDC050397]|uniref:ROK family protein n=1 Tax=Micromonospora sp. NPDC050397 TaxID=3364279 RepID=UPI00384B6916